MSIIVAMAFIAMSAIFAIALVADNDNNNENDKWIPSASISLDDFYDIAKVNSDKLYIIITPDVKYYIFPKNK